ncbi:MAG TPA: hypothetical protein DDW52_26945 [Planctomycetaceae bacterium]|nr:hypothetical protein [Planctomycetaceae bacterium]
MHETNEVTKSSSDATRQRDTTEMTQVLQLVNEIRNHQLNESKRREAWSTYVHAIIVATIISAPLAVSSEMLKFGFLAGCATVVSIIHGLLMRPTRGRWQLTLYSVVAVYWLSMLRGADFVNLLCIASSFFLCASTISAILGKRLDCGILPPDTPYDRSPRPGLSHIFAITTSYACLLTLSKFLQSGVGLLNGEMGWIGLVLLTGYGAVCSLIATTYWAFTTRRKGIPNACTGIVLLFVIQLLANAFFAATVTALQGQWDAILVSAPVVTSLLSFCLAQVAPIVVVVYLLLFTGHAAAAFDNTQAVPGSALRNAQPDPFQ